LAIYSPVEKIFLLELLEKDNDIDIEDKMVYYSSWEEFTIFSEIEKKLWVFVHLLLVVPVLCILLYKLLCYIARYNG
jgi:hypothetical protein